MDFEATALWRRTLGAREGDPHANSREVLRSAYKQFREHVEPLAAEIALSMPGYTDHSILHCDCLWETADLLTGDHFPVNPVEAFVLGGTFLVHDLGMGLAGYPGGLGELLTRPEWLDILAVRFPDSWRQLRDEALADCSVHTTPSGVWAMSVLPRNA